MPRVSEFFGITIYMYFNDHDPAHFHALYAGQEIKVEINTLSILEGYLPGRAWRMVLEWASIHREELNRNWQQARRGEPLEIIDPLE